MTFDEVMTALESARSEQIATIYSRRNPAGRVMGVRFGDLYKIEKGLKKQDALARELWAAGSFETRYLALKALTPGSLPEAEIDAWVQELEFSFLADVFAGVVYRTPYARSRMEQWTLSDKDYVRRAGFALLYNFIAEPEQGLSDDEVAAYLERIEREIHESPNWSREMMNFIPTAAGKCRPALYDAALATAMAYGKIDVFHGDKTNCKVNDAVADLQNPRVKIKVM